MSKQNPTKVQIKPQSTHSPHFALRMTRIGTGGTLSSAAVRQSQFLVVIATGDGEELVKLILLLLLFNLGSPIKYFCHSSAINHGTLTRGQVVAYLFRTSAARSTIWKCDWLTDLNRVKITIIIQILCLHFLDRSSAKRKLRIIFTSTVLLIYGTRATRSLHYDIY